MTNSYASSSTFEDSGFITEIEIGESETNVSRVNYSIQYVRGGAFRMELHSNRQHDAGSYSLVYHGVGSTWSVYDTLESQFRGHVIRTNVSPDSVIGQGTALSYGLFPELPRLLQIDTNGLSGFRLYDRASVSLDRLDGALVYRLKLEWDFFADRDVDDYWIHPRTFLILKQRNHEVKQRGKWSSTITREIDHSPKLNSLSPQTVISFNPPSLPASNP